MKKSKIQNFDFYITILIFTFCILNFLGCATYKFQHGQKPYDKGYVVSRDDYAILEYSVGKDDSVPGIKLAKERFKRRRNTVEHYYKKMGYIENHFKMLIWNPPILFLKFIGGTFRLPFYAISDYKYEHNAKYREKIKKIEEEKEAREEARINKLKDVLNNYIQKDLATEGPEETQVAQVLPKEAPQVEKAEIEQKAQEVIPQETVTEAPVKEALLAEKKAEAEKSPLEKIEPPKEEPAQKREQVQDLSKAPKAVIIAQPARGFSPLAVHFYGHKSYSKQGKIASYFWDFGDGDTSTRANPVNTYYSGSFEPKHFSVTLTVRDNQGNSASASTTVEVLNK